jgi:hypothetical protein
MQQEIECSRIDLRYESYRMRNDGVEKRLLVSIEGQGIHSALQGIRLHKEDDQVILLDGFKRYRVCGKLGISCVPMEIVADGLVAGFLNLLRSANRSALSALEQAAFIHELHSEHAMSLSEIALRVERSIGWVSMRVNLFRTMTDDIREKILQGKFPLRSYMYTLSPFTRVKNNARDVKKFIELTSGKGYSTRDIETLSRAFFSDDLHVKEQLLSGTTDWTLQLLKKDPFPAAQAPVSDKIYYALKSCRWHTAELLKQYQRSPEVFMEEQRNVRIFDLVISNCKAISKLNQKEV